MKKLSSNELKKIRNIAANLGHKLGDFQIIQGFSNGRIDKSKIPPEKLAELARNKEEMRITGKCRVAEVEIPEDAILEEARVIGVALSAKCEYCGLPIIVNDDFPSGEGLILYEHCLGPANEE